MTLGARQSGSQRLIGACCTPVKALSLNLRVAQSILFAMNALAPLEKQWEQREL